MKPILAVISLLFNLFLIYPAQAQTRADELWADYFLWGGRENQIQAITGLGGRDPLLILSSLIRVVLSFVGIFAVALLILAGFKWMLAGGDENKVADAKKTLGRAIVGLLLILASFAIVQYIIMALIAATRPI